MGSDYVGRNRSSYIIQQPLSICYQGVTIAVIMVIRQILFQFTFISFIQHEDLILTLGQSFCCEFCSIFYFKSFIGQLTLNHTGNRWFYPPIIWAKFNSYKNNNVNINLKTGLASWHNLYITICQLSISMFINACQQACQLQINFKEQILFCLSGDIRIPSQQLNFSAAEEQSDKSGAVNIKL